jgi:hypothetical protein
MSSSTAVLNLGLLVHIFVALPEVSGFQTGHIQDLTQAATSFPACRGKNNKMSLESWLYDFKVYFMLRALKGLKKHFS